ncbi:hypothetical protein PoB_002042900 [Plakobranchus ocellatus]|uniref:Uncharacterized protein n=1 Tax=Plakobranchus ocellatus TaxID=259542 RepID=A0AAV3ZJ60_9GAST|nr:hypothetical protein PoB_002042900 [Plakobranchus ocellatus]
MKASPRQFQSYAAKVDKDLASFRAIPFFCDDEDPCLSLFKSCNASAYSPIIKPCELMDVYTSCLTRSLGSCAEENYARLAETVLVLRGELHNTYNCIEENKDAPFQGNSDNGGENNSDMTKGSDSDITGSRTGTSGSQSGSSSTTGNTNTNSKSGDNNDNNNSKNIDGSQSGTSTSNGMASGGSGNNAATGSEGGDRNGQSTGSNGGGIGTNSQSKSANNNNNPGLSDNRRTNNDENSAKSYLPGFATMLLPMLLGLLWR